MRGRLPIVLALAVLVATAMAAASGGQAASSAGPPGGSPPGLAQAKAALERNRDRLLDTPGIAGVAVGTDNAGKAVLT